MDQNDINKLRGKTAVVGLAESGCGLASGWSAMEIMATAVHDALDDAGESWIIWPHLILMLKQ